MNDWSNLHVYNESFWSQVLEYEYNKMITVKDNRFQFDQLESPTHLCVSASSLSFSE